MFPAQWQEEEGLSAVTGTKTSDNDDDEGSTRESGHVPGTVPIPVHADLFGPPSSPVWRGWHGSLTDEATEAP